MSEHAARDPHTEVETDYTPEEQAAWDEQNEHERVADVTGLGPDEDAEDTPG